MTTYLTIALHLYFISGREKGIEADDQVGMTGEEIGDSLDNSGGIDRLRFKLLHNVQEVVVNLRLISELVLDLIEVGKGILDFQALKLGATGLSYRGGVVPDRRRSRRSRPGGGLERRRR